MNYCHGRSHFQLNSQLILFFKKIRYYILDIFHTQEQNCRELLSASPYIAIIHNLIMHSLARRSHWFPSEFSALRV